MTSEQAFIDWALRKLNQSNERVQACAARLSDEQMWWRGGENENALGNLILHLCGNMNQWIGTGVAGKADTRDRDSEFDARTGPGRDVLMKTLADTVAATSDIIRTLPHARLTETMNPVQGYNVTKLEAIGHVVEHFGYHTGQVVYLTKALTHADLGFYGHLRGPGVHRETTP
jgi:uncharacterized damage-inducible protein DinB